MILDERGRLVHANSKGLVLISLASKEEEEEEEEEEEDGDDEN